MANEQTTTPQNVGYEYLGCFARIRKRNGGFLYASNYGKKCFPLYRKIKPIPILKQTKTPSSF